ncbi:MAG: hypothetical protein AAFR61_22655 [Bacteroidota bacterium]
MSYQNPFRLLQASPEELGEDGRAWLKSKKKEWLAEFELAGTTTIEVGGKAWDKDGLLKVLDKLNNPVELEKEVAIMKWPELELFLTAGDTRLFKNPQWIERFSALALSQQHQTHFAEQYDRLLARAFEKKDRVMISLLTRRPLPLAAPVLALSFRNSYRFFSRRLDSLQEKREAWVTKPLRLPQVRKIFPNWELMTLFRLPDYFTDLAIKYGNFSLELIEATEQAFGSAYNPEAELTLLQRKGAPPSVSMRARQMESELDIEGKKQRSSNRIWGNVAFYFVLFVISISTCVNANRNFSSSSMDNFTSPEIHQAFQKAQEKFRQEQEATLMERWEKNRQAATDSILKKYYSFDSTAIESIRLKLQVGLPANQP